MRYSIDLPTLLIHFNIENGLPIVKLKIEDFSTENREHFCRQSTKIMNDQPLLSDLSSTFKNFDIAMGNDDVVLTDYSSKVTWSSGGGGSDLCVHVVLTSSNLVLYEAGSSNNTSSSRSRNQYNRLIKLSSVIGARIGGALKTEVILFEYEVLRNSSFNLEGCMSYLHGQERERYEHILSFSDEAQCTKWFDAINKLLATEDVSTSSNYVKKYLIFVNPVSGTGRGQHIYDSIVSQMLDEARIESVSIVTERQNHAFDIVRNESFNIEEFDAIVLIGGDGLIYEVVNGIGGRKQKGMDILQNVPLACVPGGTGNGLAKSALYESDDECYSARSATFMAIKGTSSPFDLSEVMTTNDSEKKYAFLSMSWGLISDLDIRSEWMRWIGEIRLHLAAFYFMLAKHAYNGRLLLHLVEGLGGVERATEDVTPLFDDNDFIANTPKHLLKIIEGAFQLVWIVQTPFATGSTHSGPGVELNDGLFTVFVVQDLTRFELIQLLLDVDSGDHIHHEGVQTYKAHAYRIEPFLASDKKGIDRGIFALDGESIDGPTIGPVQGRVLPGAARIMKLSREK